MKSIWLKLIKFFPLLLVVGLAASLRWFNLNWDNGFHLHPDERFLTMVQGDLELPHSWQNYLDPNTSTLNPQNKGNAFYVYGTLPLTFNKIVSVATGTDTYDEITLQGRFFSGLADVGTVILVYLLAELIWGRKAKSTGHHIGFWAAALYAVAVLPIQLSHFFAADSFLCFFSTASLVTSWRYALKPHWRHLLQTGIWFGLALGSKLTALFFAPVIGLVILLPILVQLIHQTEAGKWHLRWSWATIGQGILASGCWLMVAYCALRLASPNYFATTSWLNPHFNPRFIASLEQLKSFDGDDSWFPPAIQWIHKPPVWFSLKNLAVYGVGLPWFGLAVVGGMIVIWQSWTDWKQGHFSKKDGLILMLLFWLVGFFLYQSVQFLKVMRYFNVIYPGLALLAGAGLAGIIGKVLPAASHPKNQPSFNSLLIKNGLIIGLVISVLVWPAAFMSIYLHKHSRVTASEWMNANLPDKSYVLTEYWDDGLPLTLPDATKTFTGEQIGVFDQDTPEKWAKLTQSFMQADYYVLSSNRAWGSIMAVPDKYPRMSAYYQGLMAGHTSWELVQTITNYPSLRYLGIPIDFNTDSADEAFTVYDHPKVMVFGKNKNLP